MLVCLPVSLPHPVDAPLYDHFLEAYDSMLYQCMCDCLSVSLLDPVDAPLYDHFLEAYASMLYQ